MAIAATAVWEVRTSGNAANGGFYVPGTGTDYSQQDAPQLALTDAVANGTTAVTSATGGFTAAMVGNGACIGGGWYQVVTYVNAGTITVDRAITAGTGLALRIGGALDHPATAAASYVGGNTVWVKAGTYNVGTSANASNGRVVLGVGTAGQMLFLCGYDAARGDATGSRPLLQHTANNVTIFTLTGYWIRIQNLAFGTTGAATGGVGVSVPQGYGLVTVLDCHATGIATGFSGYSSGDVEFVRCIATNCTTGFSSNLGSAFRYCKASGGTTGFSFGNVGEAFECIATGCSSHGFDGSGLGSIIGCVAYGVGGVGFRNNARWGHCINCIAVNCAGGGFANQSASTPALQVTRSAAYNNAGGNQINLRSELVTDLYVLAAAPFVDAPNGDFRLAAGGAAIRGIAYPVVIPGTAIVNARDIGTAQSGGGGVRAVAMNGGYSG